MTFLDRFTLYHTTKFPQCIYNKTDTYQVLVLLRRYQYVPETLFEKNNMGIIGNDMRIK